MDLPGVMCRYADRFAVLGRGEHHVGSPLGAWLMLALAAPAATGELTDQIVEALGVDVVSAHQVATELLGNPKPVVSAAAAAWTREGLTGLDPWLESLPVRVQTGPVPTQDQADQWAQQYTNDLIDRFPLATTHALVVLASALATRVKWTTPFDTADAADLRGPWSTTLTRVLRMPQDTHDHDAFFVNTQRAGLLGVHRASAIGMDVTSVIADPHVAPATVLAAAHRVAVAQARHSRNLGPVSLFDLPLADHPHWSITQE
ncbi:serpin family protein [Dermatophilaceae bacterium Sec6.4]